MCIYTMLMSDVITQRHSTAGCGTETSGSRTDFTDRGLVTVLDDWSANQNNSLGTRSEEKLNSYDRFVGLAVTTAFI